MPTDLAQTASQDVQPDVHAPATSQTLTELQAAESRLLLQTYERYPLVFTSGQGVTLRTPEGHAYLDLLSGIGVCALGYNHPAITRAITEQAQQVLHVSNLIYHPLSAELAMRLTEITGLDRAFFCNSGAEAWEACLKLARAFAAKSREEGHYLGTKILALDHSFHGRTLGAVATTHKAKYREPFMPVMPGVEFVPFNDVDALRAAFSTEVCAIAIEPIQGEGGVNPVSDDFLRAARELCDSTGALLLFDEIQCGMGRTGKWCAYQHTGVTPDATSFAKPLANGLPMGAMMCTDRAAAAITPGMHGTTFGGNPLCLATAIAVIDTIRQDNLLAHITELGDYFLSRLNQLKSRHAAIVEVRGKGLMIGVEMNTDLLAKQLHQAMLDRNILLNRTHETVLRFLPPFILTQADVDRTVDALDDLLTQATRS